MSESYNFFKHQFIFVALVILCFGTEKKDSLNLFTVKIIISWHNVYSVDDKAGNRLSCHCKEKGSYTSENSIDSETQASAVSQRSD